MIVAFYKARGRLFNRLIRWWTNSEFSHCEIINDDAEWYQHEQQCYGYSASIRDNSCCRHKIIDFSETHKWELVEIPKSIMPDSLNDRIERMKQTQCSRYDYVGIFMGEFAGKIWSRVKLQIASWWYCSELCNYIVFGTREIISPQEFYDKIKALKGKQL